MSFLPQFFFTACAYVESAKSKQTDITKTGLIGALHCLDGLFSHSDFDSCLT